MREFLLFPGCNMRTNPSSCHGSSISNPDLSHLCQYHIPRWMQMGKVGFQAWTPGLYRGCSPTVLFLKCNLLSP